MNIKETRKRLGLTQRGLAEVLALGKHGYRTVQRYEAGDITPSPAILKLLRYIEKYGDISEKEK